VARCGRNVLVGTAATTARRLPRFGRKKEENHSFGCSYYHRSSLKRWPRIRARANRSDLAIPRTSFITSLTPTTMLSAAAPRFSGDRSKTIRQAVPKFCASACSTLSATCRDTESNTSGVVRARFLLRHHPHAGQVDGIYFAISDIAGTASQWPRIRAGRKDAELDAEGKTKSITAGSHSRRATGGYNGKAGFLHSPGRSTKF